MWCGTKLRGADRGKSCGRHRLRRHILWCKHYPLLTPTPLTAQAVLIIAEFKELKQRPVYNGVLGAMYSIASVAGPLMGGAFTGMFTAKYLDYMTPKA